MPYTILADGVVLVHFLWIVFLFVGVFWGVRNRTVKIFHVSGLVFALMIQIFDWYCPLTHLEIWLRAKSDPSVMYRGSFIIHYIERIIYLELSRSAIFLFTIILCGITAWAYCRKRRGKVGY